MGQLLTSLRKEAGCLLRTLPTLPSPGSSTLARLKGKTTPTLQWHQTGCCPAQTSGEVPASPEPRSPWTDPVRFIRGRAARLRGVMEAVAPRAPPTPVSPPRRSAST